MSYTREMTEYEADDLDSRIKAVAQKYGIRNENMEWKIQNHNLFPMLREFLDIEEERMAGLVLMNFYSVRSVPALIRAQAEHIERLQAQLREPQVWTQPYKTSPREG